MKSVKKVFLLSALVSTTLAPKCLVAAEPGYFPFRDAETRFAKKESSNTRIFGGTRAYWRDNPWQVAILHAKDDLTWRAQFCGATVIARNWAVTAAHCVDAGVRPDQLEIFANSDNLESGGARFPVELIIPHPQWNRISGDNDIALLRVKVPDGTRIGESIKLNDERNIPVKTQIKLTGWGVTEHRPSGSNELQGVTVPYVHAVTCASDRMWGAGRITINKFCAGAVNRDTCSGDSGGPATATVNGTNVLAGVTSSGGECGAPNKPGIYTKVANFVQWIDGEVNKD